MSRKCTQSRRKSQLSFTEDRDWKRFCERLHVDLEALATKEKALQRRRVIRRGAEILRLVLVYSICCRSLRSAAGWAARAFGIQLTDDSLRYRVCKATPYIRSIVCDLLTQKLNGKLETEGPALRLIDATVLTRPGAKGTEWRLHVTYDPVGGRVVGIEFTDKHGGEHMGRAAARPEDLLVGDRGYGHARDVRAALKGRYHCLVRVHFQNLPIDDMAGNRLRPEWIADEADKAPFDQEVMLPQEGFESEKVRLVVVPLPAEVAGRARQKIRKNAAKKGKTLSKLALRLAGYFCVVTTMSSEKASVEVLCRIYRVRWQIELLFKRGRSLLNLGNIKGGPDLVEIQVLAQVMYLVICEQWATRLSEVPIEGQGRACKWRSVELIGWDIRITIMNKRSLDERLEAIEETKRPLSERPRKKRHYAQETYENIMRILNSGKTQGNQQ